MDENHKENDVSSVDNYRVTIEIIEDDRNPDEITELPEVIYLANKRKKRSLLDVDEEKIAKCRQDPKCMENVRALKSKFDSFLEELNEVEESLKNHKVYIKNDKSIFQPLILNYPTSSEETVYEENATDAPEEKVESDVTEKTVTEAYPTIDFNESTNSETEMKSNYAITFKDEETTTETYLTSAEDLEKVTDNFEKETMETTTEMYLAAESDAPEVARNEKDMFYLSTPNELEKKKTENYLLSGDSETEEPLDVTTLPDLPPEGNHIF